MESYSGTAPYRNGSGPVSSKVGADLIVTLVHGTFARDAAWTQPESALRSSLASRFPGIVFAMPQWSAGNSHDDRIDGAKVIADHVCEQQRLNPSARHVLITHSHGGTAALYACGKDEVRAALDGVVTLGTPFIHLRKRRLRDAVRLYRIVYRSGIVVTTGASLFFVAACGLLLSALPFVWLSDRYALPLAIAVLLVSLLIAGLLLRAFVHLRRSPEAFNGCVTGILRTLRTKQREIVRRLQIPYAACRQVPILSVSATRDEARIWLKGWTAIGDLAHFLQSVFLDLTPKLPFAVVVASLIDFVVNHIHDYRTVHFFTYFAHYFMKPILGTAAFLFYAYVTGVAALTLTNVTMVVLPHIARGLRHAYGDTSLLSGWLVDTQAASSPGSAQLWIQKRVSVRRPDILTLRHSALYGDAKVLAIVGDWIAWTMQMPGSSPLYSDEAQHENDTQWLVRMVAWIVLAIIIIWLFLDPGLLWMGRWD
jgi:hypothetical protein